MHDASVRQTTSKPSPAPLLLQERNGSRLVSAAASVALAVSMSSGEARAAVLRSGVVERLADVARSRLDASDFLRSAMWKILRPPYVTPASNGLPSAEEALAPPMAVPPPVVAPAMAAPQPVALKSKPVWWNEQVPSAAVADAGSVPSAAPLSGAAEPKAAQPVPASTLAFRRDRDSSVLRSHPTFCKEFLVEDAVSP